MRSRLALILYRCLLAFYPTAFRAEFGLEMTDVFAQALAVRRHSAVKLFWRELRDWPVMVWRIHLAERSKKMTQTSSAQVQQIPANRPVLAGSWGQAGLAALAFLLYLWDAAGWVTMKAVQESLKLTIASRTKLNNGLGLTILAFMIVVVLLSWRGGWPRWSLPYLGFVLTLGLILGLSIIYRNGVFLFFATPLVFMFILLVVTLGRWLKGLRTLYERIRSDWTLLGLAYFSCVPLVFLIMLNEMPYEARADLIVTGIMALGVLAYIRSASLWQRVLVLPVAFAAASLAATFHLMAYYEGRQPYFVSGIFLILTGLEVLAMIPLVIVGILELRRSASSLRLRDVKL